MTNYNTTVERDVKLFHDKFNVKNSIEPTFLTPEDEAFRVNFIEEELNELKTALKEKNIAEVADALADIVYVSVAMCDVMGIPFTKIWDEVQRANMSKISGKTARQNNIETLKPPRHDEDVLKPTGWIAPNHKQALNL